jgi:hypothetical protein
MTMIIDRNELIEEYKLRMNVRRAIKNIHEATQAKNRHTNQTERKLRSLIRKLMVESDEKTPHRSTGINVLEDLLKKIVPQLEQEYKKLTTSEEQRESFRTHIINAVQNSLAPTKASAEAESPEEKEKAIDIYEGEGEIEINVGDDEELDVESPDDEAFIDIDGSGGEEDELSDEEKFGAGAEGDETGRNMAFHAFERIEKSIIDSYGLLSADEDRELFYDYLLTNLKLYFDKFEDELANVLPEPTTPEYEDEKDSQAADNEEGEEAASDEGGDELDLGDDAEADDELDLDL